ncbi:hypothetical protein MXB90_02320 [Phaeovulum sp. NW3]|nr:hypothetical protein [Phaeovulum sp. NW3]
MRGARIAQGQCQFAMVYRWRQTVANCACVCAMLTFKGRRSGLSRDEFDFAISMQEGQNLLAHHCEGHVLQKSHYVVPAEALTWEVDVYSGVLAGDVIAEVELPSEDFVLPLPD